MSINNNNANQMNDSNSLPPQQNAPQLDAQAQAQAQAAAGGAASAVSTEGVNDINVQRQDAGLIDDVTDGNFETNTNNNQPINSLDDASNAFLRMLQGGNSSNADNSNADDNVNAEDSASATATEPTANGETNNNSDDNTQEPQTDDTKPDTKPQPNVGLDESHIQSLINDAIQREIQNGNLPDLSAQDMTSKLANLGQQQQQQTMNNTADEGTQQHADKKEEEPDIDINSDEFFEMFTENPTEAIDKLTNVRVQQKLAPILEELEPLLEQSKKAQENKNIIDTVKAFGSEHPDFGEYNDDMLKILNEGNFPKNDINSYRNAYQTAKNNRLAGQVEQLQNQLAESEQNRGKTLDDYLGDTDSFNSLRQNENLKKAIIEDYIKALSKGGQPQMISSGGSTQPNAMPADKVNNFREAGEKFKTMLQR